MFDLVFRQRGMEKVGMLGEKRDNNYRDLITSIFQGRLEFELAGR